MADDSFRRYISERACVQVSNEVWLCVHMPAIFGFECPTCGESLGAELPAKKMVITCSACGLDFAVKRPAKDKDVSLPEQQRLSQVNHWRGSSAAGPSIRTRTESSTQPASRSGAQVGRGKAEESKVAAAPTVKQTLPQELAPFRRPHPTPVAAHCC